MSWLTTARCWCSLAETALFVVVAVVVVVALAVDLNNELPCVEVARVLKLRLVEL